jgi:hypothetical protein
MRSWRCSASGSKCSVGRVSMKPPTFLEEDSSTWIVGLAVWLRCSALRSAHHTSLDWRIRYRVASMLNAPSEKVGGFIETRPTERVVRWREDARAVSKNGLCHIHRSVRINLTRRSNFPVPPKADRARSRRRASESVRAGRPRRRRASRRVRRDCDSRK